MSANVSVEGYTRGSFSDTPTQVQMDRSRSPQTNNAVEGPGFRAQLIPQWATKHQGGMLMSGLRFCSPYSTLYKWAFRKIMGPFAGGLE